MNNTITRRISLEYAVDSDPIIEIIEMAGAYRHNIGNEPGKILADNIFTRDIPYTQEESIETVLGYVRIHMHALNEIASRSLDEIPSDRSRSMLVNLIKLMANFSPGENFDLFEPNGLDTIGTLYNDLAKELEKYRTNHDEQTVSLLKELDNRGPEDMSLFEQSVAASRGLIPKPELSFEEEVALRLEAQVA